MPRSAFRYVTSGRTLRAGASAALASFNWAINRLLRGRVHEGIASQRLDELDQRGRFGGRDLATVAGHDRARGACHVLGRATLHNLELGLHHRFGEVTLVGDQGGAVLERGLAPVEVDPGRADVRLAVDAVALEAALTPRAPLPVGQEIAAEGLLAELGAAARVLAVGQRRHPLPRQPQVVL